MKCGAAFMKKMINGLCENLTFITEFTPEFLVSK